MIMSSFHLYNHALADMYPAPEEIAPDNRIKLHNVECRKNAYRHVDRRLLSVASRVTTISMYSHAVNKA